jgi:MFS family permease
VQDTTVERSLDASIKDGASYNVMMGLGELFVVPCAVSLGAPDFLSALLTTIPIFLGSCAQVVTPTLIEKTGRRRRWYMIGATVQTLTWIPMIAAVFAPKPVGFWLLMGGFIVYYAALQFSMPAWLSVMGDLVPPVTRGRYFGRRTAICILLQFVSGTVAGLGLWIYKKHGYEAWGYATIFTGAMLARWASTYYLGRMVEPSYTHREEESFTIVQFLRRLPQSNFAKFVMFVGCLTASAQFVGCLFPLYWLRTLNYPYWWHYTACVTAIVVIQIPALLFWGRVADRYGNKRVLVVTSVAVAVLPALWLLSTHIALAVFLQMWSGFFWSGFNQSVQNFLLDAVTPPKRARCNAYLSLFTNTGLLLGGVAGAIAIRYLPADIGWVHLKYPFWTLLVISFVLRSGVVLFFLPRFREVREVPKVGVFEMLYTSTMDTAESTVNLMAGLVQRGGKET